MSDEIFVDISVDMLCAIHTQLDNYAWTVYNDHCCNYVCERSRDEFLETNYKDLYDMLYKVQDMIDSAAYTSGESTAALLKTARLE